MEIEFINVIYSLRRSTPLQKRVLDNISFKLNPGLIYGFLGNSCSGKTLIAELISLLCKPDSGEILIDNKKIDFKKIKDINSIRSQIGYVHENPKEMFLTNNVKKELEFGMKYYNYKTNSIEKRVIDALKLVNLEEEILDLSLEELSLAEQKKVALASILVYNPKVLILDEPTLGLSEKDKKELIRMIRFLKNKFSKTIIILTKDTDFLYKVANYNYVIHNGEIVEEGQDLILTNKSMLNKYDLYYPKCLKFVDLAKKKNNADLEYYKEVKDLIKGVYRDVF